MNTDEQTSIKTRTLRFHEYGKPEDVLRLEEAELPAPRQNNIRVGVNACGLNPADWALCQGLYAGLMPRGSRARFFRHRRVDRRGCSGCQGRRRCPRTRRLHRVHQRGRSRLRNSELLGETPGWSGLYASSSTADGSRDRVP